MNPQKKQLIFSITALLVFGTAAITGILLLPVLLSNASSGDYPENPAPEYIVAPQRINGLVYNGRPQALITAGQDGITYSLDQTNFTASVPTAIDAGVYYVYYKVNGDDMVYSIYNVIAPKERTVSVSIKNWNHAQPANEPVITLRETDGETKPQITYYQNGQKLYRKPTAVGQYTVEVFVPASTNYTACSATQDFAITSQIELLFDADLASYQNVTVNLGAQTQTVDLSVYSRTRILNDLNGERTLTVIADGEVIFRQVINAGQNQQIKVKG